MSPIREDELRARLHAVEPSPAVPGLADRIIEQGVARRRRRRWAVGLAAAAAVGVIGVGALAVGDGIGRDDALPASPSPTPTVVETTPVVTPTGSPTASPSSTPSSSVSPSVPTASPSSVPVLNPTPDPSPSVPLPSTSGPAPEVQRPVTLLHAGSWARTNTFAGACGADIFPTAGARNAYAYEARATAAVEGRADREVYQFFASAADAAAFMNDLRAQSRACDTTTDGAMRGIVEGLSGPWSDGLALSWFPNDTSVSGGSVVLAVRSGSAVTLSGASGSFTRTDRVDPALLRAARPSVEHVYPQLGCGLTEQGCRT
ncbi:hypothetical protein ACOCJ5_13185 [Knoellia sp. CPCC 206450]|uniref:hypothetical protein n=1 Tax=Knoellia tibetensis TaxID=3404798 RepID=UPI003B433462